MLLLYFWSFWRQMFNFFAGYGQKLWVMVPKYLVAGLWNFEFPLFSGGISNSPLDNRWTCAVYLKYSQFSVVKRNVKVYGPLFFFFYYIGSRAAWMFKTLDVTVMTRVYHKSMENPQHKVSSVRLLSSHKSPIKTHCTISFQSHCCSCYCQQIICELPVDKLSSSYSSPPLVL